MIKTPRLIAQAKLMGFMLLNASWVFNKILKAIVICYYPLPLGREPILYLYQYIRFISMKSSENCFPGFGSWQMQLFPSKRLRLWVVFFNKVNTILHRLSSTCLNSGQLHRIQDNGIKDIHVTNHPVMCK